MSKDSRSARRAPAISNIRQAGPDHRVVTVTREPSETYDYRKTPCPECPWRKDAPIGAFPAEAFRESATTAYDMAETVFSCHMATLDRPQTCAGFLLQNSEHNLQARLLKMRGRVDPHRLSTDTPLYESYVDMAVANGVSPDDPVLAPCRN